MRRRRALLGTVAALLVTGAAGVLEPAEPTLMPGPAPQRASGDRAAQNAACEACHPAIAAEWRASLHRRAQTDPAYLRAFAREPLPFCQACHAPEADPRRAVPAPAASMGVGCVTCHAPASAVLGVPRVDAGAAPHPVLRAPAFASAGACAACHDFPFPDAALRAADERMQATATEHRASPFAGVRCAGCHMPAVSEPGGGAHASHAFVASRDAATVRGSVGVEAERISATGIRVRLSTVGVGHALPTGDLFRRIEVLAEVAGAEQQVLASRAAYLMRHFHHVRQPDGRLVRVQRLDDRVRPGAPRVVELDLGAPARCAVVSYRVAYQRVAHPTSERADDAVVGGEIVLAEGSLQPGKGTACP